MLSSVLRIIITGEIFFQFFAQDNNAFWLMKKFRQKWLVKKSKLVWRKKLTWAQIFRYFRYESRNNYSNYFVF